MRTGLILVLCVISLQTCVSVQVSTLAGAALLFACVSAINHKQYDEDDVQPREALISESYTESNTESKHTGHVSVWHVWFFISNHCRDRKR